MIVALISSETSALGNASSPLSSSHLPSSYHSFCLHQLTGYLIRLDLQSDLWIKPSRTHQLVNQGRFGCSQVKLKLKKNLIIKSSNGSFLVCGPSSLLCSQVYCHSSTTSGTWLSSRTSGARCLCICLIKLGCKR